LPLTVVFLSVTPVRAITPMPSLAVIVESMSLT
jgi:hypothetical protein